MSETLEVPSGGLDMAAPGMRWDVPADRRRSYSIHVAEPLLDPRNPALLSGGDVAGRRFVVLDNNLAEDIRPRLEAYLAANNVEAEFLVLDGGENCKSMQVALHMVEALEAFGLDRRREPLILIGGGALLDVGGFAASIYRRGVPFIRVPTTLLAYVDASVGVKTGVNFGQGKNLIGAFEPPYAVLLEREFLKTLPAREIASGLGEVLKLAAGCDPQLLQGLVASAQAFRARRFDDPAVVEVLHRSIVVMLRELRENLYEADLTRAVDLGHTFSQALELQAKDIALRHGEAVALDINLCGLISARRGLLARDELAAIGRLTHEVGLPTRLPELTPDALWRSVRERTRHRGGHQRIPIPAGSGRCAFIDDLTEAELQDTVLEFGRGDWW
ncbi:MAG: sedoheptulose 7-phosphate cyclase [Methylobacterium sp.]|nr:sedoheptulose 7-phosphate cyclase [Methylobacterium sp.]